MKDRAITPFINMYYWVIIVSLLIFFTGFLAKLKFIVIEKYNCENLIIGGIIFFISGTIIFGVSFLFVSFHEENETKPKVKK